MGVVMNEQPGKRRNSKSLRNTKDIFSEDVLNRSILALSTDLTKTWSVLGNGFREKGEGNASSRDSFGLRVSG